jgi:pyrrolysine biosynthesis protein PylD
MGCGPVGRSAVQALLKLNSKISIYDVNSDCYNLLFKVIDKADIHIINHLDKALHEHEFIIEATPVGDVIHTDHIDSKTFISAPGFPLGLDEAAVTKIGNRLLHDPLQIGVATMTIGVVADIS